MSLANKSADVGVYYNSSLTGRYPTSSHHSSSLPSSLSLIISSHPLFGDLSFLILVLCSKISLSSSPPLVLTSDRRLLRRTSTSGSTLSPQRSGACSSTPSDRSNGVRPMIILFVVFFTSDNHSLCCILYFEPRHHSFVVFFTSNPDT